MDSSVGSKVLNRKEGLLGILQARTSSPQGAAASPPLSDGLSALHTARLMAQIRRACACKG
eukprot:6151452-Pleurochrysis_carterae.AAC.1